MTLTTYTVTYDLRNESGSQDYEPLWAELKRLGGHRTQYSMWLVNVSNTPKELHDHIKGFLDKDDRLWVAELTKLNHYSGAISGTNDWLTKNPPSR
jgi:hypothetical protein